MFENLWNSFLEQTTWMIDTAMISVVSVPGKPLFLYCKHALITDLVCLAFWLLKTNYSLFDIQLIVTQPRDLALSSYLLLDIHSFHNYIARTGNGIVQLNLILLMQHNAHQLHLCCVIQCTFMIILLILIASCTQMSF